MQSFMDSEFVDPLQLLNSNLYIIVAVGSGQGQFVVSIMHSRILPYTQSSIVSLLAALL